MGRMSRLGNDLYGGRKSFDFVGKRLLWYTISAVLVALAVVIVVIRGLNFGIEFTGGVQYRVAVDASQVTQENADRLREAVAGTGVEAAESPNVTTAAETALLVQTEDLTAEESDILVVAILETVDVADPANDISQDEIGASWGQEVAERAVLGIAIFLVLVMLFIGFYFREWKMSLAALVALTHDIAITVGVYSFSGFQVTPSAVTGLLAILGFSLYDTVVVFDKVKENTNLLATTRQTYAQAANLAVNQTLVRSINTGIVALIPIGAILYVSASQLGASSLQDLALAQFVGMAVGVYSSIFLAPRVLVHLKSNETAVVLAEKRAKARERRAADPYLAVPVFRDDLPISDAPEDMVEEELDDRDDDERLPSASPRPRSSPEALGRGRVVPAANRPVTKSASSGRQQPTRQPKSKRGKK